MNVIGSVEICHKCQRKLLVEMVLIGTNHSARILVTCWECLDAEARAKAETLYGITESSVDQERELGK